MRPPVEALTLALALALTLALTRTLTLALALARCGIPSKPYRYLDRASQTLDFEGMLADINAAAPRSVFLLHACAHLSSHVRPGASVLYVRGTGYAYQPPACCTYQRPRAAGAPPYVCSTRTRLRRAGRSVYRGTQP